MEENPIIQSLSILLYSRTLDTLFLQVYHSQTKQLVTKKYITTSSHTWLNLGIPLSNIEMMVKRNEENVQILSEFVLEGPKEEMGHYIKMKKRFDQFELLFQVFARNKSNINSVQSLLDNTNKDFVMMNTNQSLLKLPQTQQPQQQQQKDPKYIKHLAQTNLSLLTHKALTTVLTQLNKKKISLPSQQPPTFRKRKDEKTFTYNARINKLKKEITGDGGKLKNRARSEKEVGNKPVEAGDEKGSDVGGKRQRGVKGNNGFALRKPNKMVMDVSNNDSQSFEATKLSFPRSPFSRNKLTFLNTSLSITSQLQQPPSPSLLTKQLSHPFSIPEQQPKLNKFSYSIHQKIVEESWCEKYRHMREGEQNGDGEKHQGENKERRLCKEGRAEKLYEDLRVLCGRKSMMRSGTKVRRKSERHSGAVQISRSQQINTEPPYLNLIKKCSQPITTTKPANSPLFPLRKAPTFKQHFYQNLYLKTLQSIQNQSQILDYVKAHCDTLNSKSTKRQARQYTTVVRGKENLDVRGKERTVEVEGENHRSCHSKELKIEVEVKKKTQIEVKKKAEIQKRKRHRRGI